MTDISKTNAWPRTWGRAEVVRGHRAWPEQRFGLPSRAFNMMLALMRRASSQAGRCGKVDVALSRLVNQRPDAVRPPIAGRSSSHAGMLGAMLLPVSLYL